MCEGLGKIAKLIAVWTGFLREKPEMIRSRKHLLKQLKTAHAGGSPRYQACRTKLAPSGSLMPRIQRDEKSRRTNDVIGMARPAVPEFSFTWRTHFFSPEKSAKPTFMTVPDRGGRPGCTVTSSAVASVQVP